jgi:23S rRNA (cytosine1962-C5)-methyltransferase
LTYSCELTIILDNMINVILKPGREKTARQHHPWLFSGAIFRVDGKPHPGEIVRVIDAQNEFVAYGYFNSHSQIQIRLLEWDEAQRIDESWWHSKLELSIVRRNILARNSDTDSYRLVYGEADLLPGLIVDRYADWVVIQVLTAGIENVKESVISSLESLLHPAGIYERSDVETRSLEGLEKSVGRLAGIIPPDIIAIKENGLNFNVDIKGGQKTGFYLDQRDNRQAVSLFANNLDVLDCFSYTGGFSIYALGNGARSVTLIDSSSQSLSLAQENIKLNNFEMTRATLIEGDVFKILREFRENGKRFDMVILDPPKFAPRKTDLKRALAGYKDINMLTMNILKPNGILASFSCSGAVDLQSLQTVLFWATTDANREIQIIKTLSQGLDHPCRVSFPESEYLKGFICVATGDGETSSK